MKIRNLTHNLKTVRTLWKEKYVSGKICTAFSLNTESTYDWNSEECSVPINLTVAQLLKIGPQIIQIGGGVRYWADSSENGSQDWGARIQLTFLFPK